MKVGDVVRVEWLDATGPADLAPDEDLDIAIASTVGRVRFVDADRVVLAGEWFTDPEMYERACTAIPRVCIRSCEVLI